MRILFLTQFFQPEPIFKGLPFARALRDRGHEVEVLTGFPNYPGGRLYPGYPLKPWRREMMDGVPVVRVPLFPSHDGSGARRVGNYLSFAGSSAVIGPWLTRRPDIVYVYNLVTLAATWRMLRRLHGCRVVLDVQDLWPESVASSGMMGSRGALGLLRWWSANAYKSADAITVLSPGFKYRLVSLGVPAERIQVIYNWCDESDTEISDEQIAAERCRAGFGRRFTILFSGTMGKVQALDRVLEAAAILERQSPEILFAFIGGGVEVDRLKARAARSRNVVFLPRCSPQEAFRTAKAADALLVHLRDDPLFSITIPSKTQAYLRAGRPILMGVRGDAAELVQRAGAGLLFAPEDAHALSTAALKLYQMHESERAAMGRRGKAFYDEELCFTRAVDEFEDVFFATLRQGLRGEPDNALREPK